jgi:uncharacterized protein
MYLIIFYTRQSAIEGRGLFAAKFIPKGTIVYFYSCTDQFYSKEKLESLSEEEKQRLFRYGVEDEFGNWNMTETGPDIVEANHSCDANILSLFVDGLYCDIAIRDIYEDEEITIDYGMFYSSYPWQIECKCDSPICRKIIGSGIPIASDIKNLWHSRLTEAAKYIFNVKQPLFSIDNGRAKILAQAIMGKQHPRIFSYTKFSMISDDNNGA